MMHKCLMAHLWQKTDTGNLHQFRALSGIHSYVYSNISFIRTLFSCLTICPSVVVSTSSGLHAICSCFNLVVLISIFQAVSYRDFLKICNVYICGTVFLYSYCCVCRTFSFQSPIYFGGLPLFFILGLFRLCLIHIQYSEGPNSS